MSKQVLSGVSILVDDMRLDDDMNQVALSYEADAPEITCMADDTHKHIAGGLKTVAVSGEGFFSAADPDSKLFAVLGLNGKLIGIAPGSAEGGVAYMFDSVIGEYSPLQGGVGDAASFSLNAGAYGDLLRGILMQNGIETASFNGSGRNLGAVSATQKLYAGLFVFDSSGDGSQTLDVDIESDVDDLWGSPTVRDSFTQITTATGSELREVSGAITDTWFRIAVTIGGTGSPSFDFAVILAIL